MHFYHYAQHYNLRAKSFAWKAWEMLYTEISELLAKRPKVIYSVWSNTMMLADLASGATSIAVRVTND